MKKTLALLTTLSLTCSLPAAAADADAAKALLKKNDCFKCHALDKKKDGPPYKEVASKHRGEPNVEQALYKHLTTSPKIKIDGKEEEHKKIKATDEEIKNLIAWMLTL